MLWRIVRPMRRKGTSFPYFTKRIPADVLPLARGRTLQIPVGDETAAVTLSAKTTQVRLSLRTRDPQATRERQGAISAHLDKVWQGFRDGPVSLSHKQTVALAGDLYRAWVAAFENNPGSPELWQNVLDTNAWAAAGNYAFSSLMIGSVDGQVRRAMEKRFGAFVDGMLARQALSIDDNSRARLLDQFAAALDQAAEQLQKNAQGDYSPDTRAARFPAWEAPASPLPSAKASAPTGAGFEGLVADWWKEQKVVGMADSTHEAYRSTARRFARYLGHDNPTQVTTEDVVGFKDHRLENGVSAKTVKDGDLACLKGLLGWAKRNGRVASNPAADVTIKLAKRRRTRPKGFTDAEAVAVLSAALQYHNPAELPKTQAAKRWAPWLCAYTGARIGEMLQLRREDLRREGGMYVITITPEAGTVKSKAYREVPVHPHLVEMGFPEFVDASPPGHLFVTPRARDDNVLRPLKGVENRVREFVRTVVADKAVQPNHAWRHRFKTVGMELGLSERVLDAIQGHASRTAGEDYGDVTLVAKARVVEGFPRFDVPIDRLAAES